MMIKKLVYIFYILVVLTLATATIVEHFIGTPATHTIIYGSWWFILLWALLAFCGTFYLVSQFHRRRLTAKDCNTLLIHLSFVIILLGALLTHTTSSQGIIHLRGDKPIDHYEEMTVNGQTHKLPFSVKLNNFKVDYHDGTSSPMDYETHFDIMDGAKKLNASVSMNHIFTYRHYRIYQASFDTDNMGSYLSVNYDPWGITTTYIGYTMLFLSLIFMLILPETPFRQLLRSPLLRKGLFVMTLLILALQTRAGNSGMQVNAPIVDKEVAKNFGRLFIYYNGRICPVQTFALDFTQKIYGNHRYRSLTAEQVLLSWIFYAPEWSNEPFIHVKSKPMREQLNLNEYSGLNAFFNTDGYRLGPVVYEYNSGQRDSYHKACMDIDSKIQILMSLRTGSSLMMIPYKDKETIKWYGPADALPKTMSHGEMLFAKTVFSMLFHHIIAQQNNKANDLINKWRKLQLKDGGASLPSPTQVKAELFYNSLPLSSVLFMANLFLGLLCLTILIHKVGMGRPDFHGLNYRWCVMGAQVLLCLSWSSLTLVLALRGIIADTVPMSNGYETMLFIAWIVMLFMFILSLCLRNVAMLACSFGFLLSGFFLLVSHINLMDPAIGHLMPVLNSPLLSIHVSIIMISFALLSLTFICGLTGLAFNTQERELQALSRLFLYPAVTTLGMGIFIGAIWANISWGNYWSWDPKETWALITLLVYAVPLHTQSLSSLQRPRAYHIMMILAFLTLIMTYFGVNYFLEGMHSYA